MEAGTGIKAGMSTLVKASRGIEAEGTGMEEGKKRGVGLGTRRNNNTRTGQRLEK